MFTKSVLCLALAFACCATQVFGQSLCSGNGDCSSVTGQYCAMPGGCKKGYCMCPAGQWNQASKCVNVPTPPTKTQLGGTCSADTDCGGYPGATCQSSKCTCISYLTPASDNMNCMTFSNSATCSGSQLCGASTYGSCSSGTCKCNTGYQWATGGDIPAPGACVASGASLNQNQGSTCTSTSTSSWYSDSSSKFCSSNLHCGSCPEGGSLMCMSGSVTLTAAFSTIVLAALLSLFM